MPEVAKCSTCGRAIIWTTSPNGARLPLDARPVTMYYLDDAVPPNAIAVTAEVIKAPTGPARMLFATEIEPEPTTPRTYVSHFVTCPQAAEHSRAKR